MGHDDKGKLFLHRKFLEFFNRLINSPALINIESNTISQEGEVIKENNFALFIVNIKPDLVFERGQIVAAELVQQ